MTVVGLISDTHGLLRPEALDALRGASLILHAGDVGDVAILDRLQEVAPVVAVRGNVDVGGEWARLPLTQTVEVDGARIHVIHDLDDLDGDPEEHGDRVVVFGHTHQPLVKQAGAVTYVNPGSAGPRRFRLPIGVGRLYVDGGTVRAELIDLGPCGKS